MSETPMPSLEPAPPAPPTSRRARWLPRTEGPPGFERAGAMRGESSPLAGIRVLDLTGAWIGPFAAMLLADLGADVIKVESPVRPDIWRGYRPGATTNYPRAPIAQAKSHPWNVSAYYNSVNRNKRSLSLDLSRPEGRDLLLQLVPHADVLMENYTPRVMANFGLGYEVLRKLNPGLIMASFSGYGSKGPWRDFRANGATTETTGGWASLFGYPDQPPMLMGEMEADPLCGLHMAALTLVALEHREQTGVGQAIDGSMLEAAVGYIAEEVLMAQLPGAHPHPRGNRDRSAVPQGVYPAKGVDAWIAITIRDDDDWAHLVDVASRSAALQDSRFACRSGRLAQADELDARIAEWTSTQAGAALVRKLQRAGVPAALVLRTDEVLREPHLKNWFRALDHPDTGSSLHGGHLWRWNRSPLVWNRPPPRLGQHSEEVLAEELAVSHEQFIELAATGVTGGVAPWPGPD